MHKLPNVLFLAPSMGNAMAHEVACLLPGFSNGDLICFCYPSHVRLNWNAGLWGKLPFLSSRRKPLAFIFQVLSVFNVVFWIKLYRFKPNLVHIYNGEGYPISIILALYAKFTGSKILVTIHDPEPHPGNILEWFNSKLGLLTLALSDAFHLNSAVFINTRKYPWQKNRVVEHIPLGAVYSVFTNPDRTDNAPFFDILLFGRIEKYKGIDVLLKAHVESGFKYKVKILGRGTYSRAVQAAVEGMPNVTFENRFIDDCEVEQHIVGCRVVVLPYTQASQSSLPLLAAYWKKGLVCSSLGGLISDCLEVGGVLVSPNDPSDLLRGIDIAMRSPTTLPESRSYSFICPKFEALYLMASHSLEGICI